jgi:putative hemolysin
MRFLATLGAPLVHIVNFSTDLVIRVLGVQPSNEPTVTPEEIQVLIKEGTEIGVLGASEQEMIDAILRLDKRRIGAFMTPRTKILAIDTHDTTETIRRKIAESEFSSFPVIEGDLDRVRGVVSAKDLLNQSLAGEPLDLHSVLRDPLIVPESNSALQVLEQFSESTMKIALIADEYGGIEGIVTHRDILEDIAGSFPRPRQFIEPAIVERSDGSQLVDGLLPIEEFKELLGLPRLPEEAFGRYQTVGGFVMAIIGNIPKTGEAFAWENYCIEVVDMDGHRVDKVLLTPMDSNPPCADDDGKPSLD